MDFDFHSLWRGFQSAVFYYVSCAPCTARAANRKRRKQVARDRAERDALQRVQPSVYRQPSPYRTNEWWAEEIRLGPGPPSRRLNKKQKAARAKAMSRPVPEVAGTGLNEKATPGAEPGRTPAESSLELAAVDGVRGPPRPGGAATAETERWKLNQREDEDLWGSATYPGSESSKAASGTGNDPSTSSEKFPSFPIAASHLSSKYDVKTPGNPPINDLHPPVVSNPAFSSGSNMWMLQPPPPIAIMKGYESPSNNRSRSTTASSGSRSSRRGGGSTASSSMLGRRLSQRLVEEKLRRGEMLYPSDLRRVSSNRSANTDALRIEAKYFEDPVVSKRRQDRLSDQSTETVLRPQGKAVANGNDVFGKADSGVEMKILPGSKENVENGTQRQDFAFPDRQGKTTIPPLDLSAELPGDTLSATDTSNTQRLIPRRPPPNQASITPTTPRTQNKGTPKRFHLSQILSDSPARSDRSSEDESIEVASRPRGSVGDDADDEGNDGDDDNDDDKDGTQRSKKSIPRQAETSKNDLFSNFDRRPQSRQALQPSQHNARWYRRRSVDF